ncbi:uncharacterized protein [Rutidosis leptorrhynchoides]|uniref:uncharacterized protein n=1 Tax=Rutidosis leptorrhynchoides TaxID=125765 RepID=UPI003A99B6CA
MAIVRHFGYPDLFITFTCNPNWPEIARFLNNKQQKPEDRPDIICRLFKIKLDSMIEDLKKKELLYRIEFQKRGLPHAHICTFLKASYKLTTSQDIDSIISAEIPDKSTNLDLYELVADFMMHGPCGTQNPKSACMNETTKTCTKSFPKRFQEHASVDENGYPVYRRRDNESRVYKGEAELHNGYVVPYNPFLLKKFQSHINVERCNQSGAIKYLFKYINKGYDRITAGLVRNDDSNGEVAGKPVMVKSLENPYISACEAAWRIFGNEIHYRTHAVERLSFHLPNEQPVTFEDDADLQDVIEKPSVASSQFTSWMERNTWDQNARNLTYTEFPQKYVWNAADRVWTVRKIKPKLGRIHHVPPSAGEAYYLRILLNKVRGPTCFEDIRTVNGKICPTFKDACYELGLLDDDKEYIEAIQQASQYSTGPYLRSLFVMLLVSNNLSRPEDVWSQCSNLLSEDIHHKQRKRLAFPAYTMEQKDIDNHALYEIELLLRNQGSSLKKFSGIPYPSSDFVIDTTNRLIHDELRYDRVALKSEHDILFSSLTSEQKGVYDEIMSAVHNNVGGVFFEYGYGGTGKTFLWKTLSTAIRSKGKIVLNIASSGIASLLLSGGRTAHSRFVIPININEDSICSINVNSQLADLLRQASLIIWDEAPMIHKHCFEALDRTLRDIMRQTSPENEDKVFGGKVVIFGGDFRQILPVVPKGSRQDIVNASLNSSYLWDHIKILKLTINMRLQSRCNTEEVAEMKAFANWILDVGNGTVGGENDGEVEIIIPNEFLIKQTDDPITSIVDSTYPNLINNLYESAYFQERAILAPTHEHVDKINDRLLQLVPGEEMTYLSCDGVDASDNYMTGHRGMQTPEFLNSLKFAGIPNHKLVLKIGVPIMLLRNIDQLNGLCNGTRLRVIKLEKSVITARVITGTNIGFETLIPRMKMSPSDNTLPFKITRKQFPVSMCFAMTINKSQGQSLSQVGLYLPRPVFTHEHLYVAISRVKNKNGLKILICDKDVNVSNTTTNVVYKEIGADYNISNLRCYKKMDMENDVKTWGTKQSEAFRNEAVKQLENYVNATKDLNKEYEDKMEELKEENKALKVENRALKSGEAYKNLDNNYKNLKIKVNNLNESLKNEKEGRRYEIDELNSKLTEETSRFESEKRCYMKNLICGV